MSRYNRTYISELKYRNCYRGCNIRLDFHGFVMSNFSPEKVLSLNRYFSLEELKKIWESKHIQVFCCNCHKRLDILKKVNLFPFNRFISSLFMKGKPTFVIGLYKGKYKQQVN